MNFGRTTTLVRNSVCAAVLLVSQQSLSSDSENDATPYLSESPRTAAPANYVERRLVRSDYIQLIAAKLFTGQDEQILADFIEIGYEQDEATRLTNDLATSLATCMIDAISDQAARRSLDPEPYYRFFAGNLGDPTEVTRIFGKFDLEAATQGWKPCMSAAWFGAGLQPRAE